MTALLSTLLASCSGTGTGVRSPSALAPALPTPLATSVQSSAGTWATLPMGHLDQPLNTFWQLFFRPAAGGSWSNHVEATAEATNGGLVLAASQGQGLLVGIRPSYLLTFSPLIYTADAARSWSTGLVPAALAERPGALAAGSPGQALALVSARGGAQVLRSVEGINGWRTLTSETTLARTAAGRACGLGAITAVAYLAGASISDDDASPEGEGEGEALVAGSCAHPGVVGMFVERAGRWQALHVGLPGALARDRVEVLSAQSTPAGVSALLGASGASGTSLLAVSYAHGRWRSSTPLPVPAGAQVASFGPAGGQGVFALLTASSQPDELAIASAAGGRWQLLAPPPAGTETVAWGAASTVEALAVNGNVLTVWALHAHTWVRQQTIDVQIEYGSSE